jgi:hypothetical protein
MMMAPVEGCRVVDVVDLVVVVVRVVVDVVVVLVEVVEYVVGVEYGVSVKYALLASLIAGCVMLWTLTAKSLPVTREASEEISHT